MDVPTSETGHFKHTTYKPPTEININAYMYVYLMASRFSRNYFLKQRTNGNTRSVNNWVPNI